MTSAAQNPLAVEPGLKFQRFGLLPTIHGIQHLGMGAEVNTKLAYTVEEAADLLSLSRAHLYRLIDTCELGSVTIGRSRRITHSQLDAFLARLEAANSSKLLRFRRECCPPTPLLRPSDHEQKSR